MYGYSGRKAYGLRARDLPFWGIERVFLLGLAQTRARKILIYIQNDNHPSNDFKRKL